MTASDRNTLEEIAADIAALREGTTSAEMIRALTDTELIDYITA